MKYYVVWKGRKPGVYSSWADCTAQVGGFSGAQFKAFPTREDADAAFQGAYESHISKDTPPVRKHTAPICSNAIPESYCVDASCPGNPGPVEYRCVHNATRNSVFSAGPYPGGSCNIGEFLAIAHALAFLVKHGIDAPIYSDSLNAIAWVRAKKCRTTIAPTPTNAPLFELIARAEQWLHEHTYPNRILKWDTRAWGEIPADYHRK